MISEAVLIKLTVADGRVAAVASTGPGDHSHLVGFAISDLLRPLPQGGRFVQVAFAQEGRYLTAAAKCSGSEYFVYLLTGPGSETCAGIPYIRLAKSAPLPAVSPGMVALLGYTPWELTESDLLQTLAPRLTGEPLLTSVLDRWGGLREVVCSISTTADGSGWIWMTEVPRAALAGWERVIEDWESRPLVSAESELETLLRAVGLPAGALADRSGGEPRLLCSSGLRVEKEDLLPGGVYGSEAAAAPVWLDASAIPGCDGSWHHYVAPFGRGERYLAVLSGASSPVLVEQRAKVLLPVLSMRLDLLGHARSNADQESRRALLEDIEQILQARCVKSWSSLQPCLETLASEIGARALVLLGQELPSGVVAAPGTSKAEIECLDAGKGEQFPAVLSVRIRDDLRLAAGFSAPSPADQALLRSLGRMLERYCLGGSPAQQKQPDALGVLPVLYMEDFKVVWQGAGPSLRHCWEYWGETGVCDGCPLSAPPDARLSRMRFVRDGTLEEIIPGARGHALLHARLPRDQQDHPHDMLPGGTAVYDAEGVVRAWSSWFEAVTGIPPQVAVGQHSARLVEKLGSERVCRQLEKALEGLFLPESVEFTISGRRCHSRMVRGPAEGTIHHFVLDNLSAGLGDVWMLAGPGLSVSAEKPVEIGGPLTSACEIKGWEMDTSPTASESGGRTWLSQGVLSELLLDILRTMTPMCPERWVALDTRDIGIGSLRISRPVLPGRYHVLQFTTYPVLLDSQTAALAALEREMTMLGGWLARPESGDGLEIGFPAARKKSPGAGILLYSPDPVFLSFAEEVLGQTYQSLAKAPGLEELAEMQQAADLVILRVKPHEFTLVASLMARMPEQGILLATGLKPATPFLSSRIEVIQLPATAEELLGSVRRMLIV